MKSILFIALFLLCIHNANAQQPEDSLRAVVNRHTGDRAEVDALVYAGHQQMPLDSTIRYAQEGLSLARRIKYREGEADCLMLFQEIFFRQGNFSQAIQSALAALAIYEDMKDYEGIVSAHAMLQAVYREAGDYRKALSHAFLALRMAEAHNLKAVHFFTGHRWAPLLLAEIGGTYVLMNQPDSALFYIQKSIERKELFNGGEWGFPVYLLATVQTMKGQYKPALEKYRTALVLSVQNGFAHDTLQIFSGMSTLFRKAGQLDSAIHYAQIVAQGWKHQSEFKNLLEAVSNLAQVYKAKGNTDSAFKYVERTYAIKDSIFSAEKNREVQSIAFNAKLKEEEIKAAQATYKSRMQLYVLVAGLLVLLLISAVLWRNNRHKQKAKAKIERAYAELEAAQAQLVQREKMASLGELTAGIAHEIQNPLNFVNNFSEINNDLLDEMQENLDKGGAAEAKMIAADIKENNSKITHHGKRADNIVKNMMEHSRPSAGEKQPVDINALADEYLRLSYHGIRAKDRSFNAGFHTDFDNSIDKVYAVPQDMGRVLLNLFNNAFYAVNQKKVRLNGDYEPSVSVGTKREKDKIKITVRDNGTGIPEKVIHKIFQPFFTTKPTGEGTGLGLSLSYDIITKGHGGELKVNTKEGEYTEFTVLLPA